jgi:hypothetical protein
LTPELDNVEWVEGVDENSDGEASNFVVTYMLASVLKIRAVVTANARRSHRMRIQPLEYWRNEKVILGRRKSGTTM